MKHYFTLAIAAFLALGFAACSSKNEESKFIAGDQIKMSGEYPFDLSVAADSVKIMLVNKEEDNWEVKAILPLAKDDVHGKQPSLAVVFLDANGNELDYDLKAPSEDIESVFAADGSSVDVPIANPWMSIVGDYKEMKTLFDKVAGIKVSLKYYIKTASADDDDDVDLDVDDIYDEAEKLVDKAYKDADKMMKDAQKQADDAMKAAMKAAGY